MTSTPNPMTQMFQIDSYSVRVRNNNYILLKIIIYSNINYFF
jgi:hypothetical protein